MPSVVRWIRTPLLLLAVVLVVAWATVSSLRWLAMGPPQREALALMQGEPPAAEGANGYGWLIMADYVVAPEEVDAAVAGDVAHFVAWLESSAVPNALAGDVAEAYVPQLQDAFAKRPALSHLDPLCNLGAAPCLAKLRTEPDALRAQLQRHAARLDFAERSLAAPQFATPYPSAMEAPLANFGSWRLVLTSVAVDFDDGRTPQALRRGCDLLADARRINRDSGRLLERMVSQALAESAAVLLLEMRHERPDQALPPECAVALAPLQEAEFLVCSGLQGEFRMHALQSRRFARQLAGLQPKNLLFRTLLFDEGLQNAWVASAMAPYCDEPHRQAIRRGELPEPAPAAGRLETADCYGAYVSCVLASIATPSYRNYASRMLDHGAKLHLLLAAHAVASGERSFAQAAADPFPGFALAADGGARTLELQLRDPALGGGRAFRVDVP